MSGDKKYSDEENKKFVRDVIKDITDASHLKATAIYIGRFFLEENTDEEKVEISKQAAQYLQGNIDALEFYLRPHPELKTALIAIMSSNLEDNLSFFTDPMDKAMLAEFMGDSKKAVELMKETHDPEAVATFIAARFDPDNRLDARANRIDPKTKHHLITSFKEAVNAMSPDKRKSFMEEEMGMSMQNPVIGKVLRELVTAHKEPGKKKESKRPASAIKSATRNRRDPP